jgi:acyl carrier protein
VLYCQLSEVSDEFPSIPDVLNDNAGVVGAAAGLAVSRNVQAANRSVRQLQDQVTSLQRDLAKSRAKDEWEEWHREKLYKIFREANTSQCSPTSSSSFLDIASLAYRFHKTIPDTSAFRSIQDKEFLQTTASLVAERWKSACAVFPSALEELKLCCAWYKLRKITRRIMAIDRTQERAKEELKLQVGRLDAERSAKKSFWLDLLSGKSVVRSAFFYAALLSFVVGSIILFAVSTGIGVLMILATPIFLMFFSINQSDLELRCRNIAAIKDDLEAQLKQLRKERDELRVAAVSMAHVPSELVEFIADESAPLQERLDKHYEVASYADSLIDALGVAQAYQLDGIAEWIEFQKEDALGAAPNDAFVTDDQILESLARLWDISPLRLTPDALLVSDLGLDPEMVMAGLEMDFRVKFEEQAINAILTIRDVIDAARAALLGGDKAHGPVGSQRTLDADSYF